MKENKSANFGPRLHNGDTRLYTSKPLKNKLKPGKHYGVKNVSLTLQPTHDSNSSISTHTTALRNGSLGSNKASSRRYELAHETSSRLISNSSYSELSQEPSSITLFDPQDFIEKSSVSSRDILRAGVKGPRPPYPQQMAFQKVISPSPIPSITSPEYFYHNVSGTTSTVPQDNLRTNCMSSCSDLNDKEFMHVAEIPRNRMPVSKIESVPSLARRHSSDRNQGSILTWENLCSTQYAQGPKRPSTTRNMPKQFKFINKSEVISPSELSIRTGADHSLAIHDLSVALPPRTVVTSRGASRSQGCFSSLSSSQLNQSRNLSRAVSKEKLMANVSIEECKKKLNPTSMRGGAFSRVHQIMYNSKHKKNRSTSRQDNSRLTRRNSSFQGHNQQVKRPGSMAKFLTRRQTETSDLFGLSSGSLQIDNFYSARYEPRNVANPPQEYFHTLSGPELQTKLPQKQITLPIQKSQNSGMVHNLVPQPKESPCKSVEIVNSITLEKQESDLPFQKATEVIEYSKDIDTRESPGHGIPSVSVNHSEADSEEQQFLRKLGKDVSTSINQKDIELYLKAESTPSFPGIPRNKVFLDASRSIDEKRESIPDPFCTSFSGSGLVKSRDKSEKEKPQQIFNISMSSQNPLEGSWKLGTLSDLDLLSMSPPTDKQEVHSTPAQASEQYETAKKDFAKVLGSQVKYYTLNLQSSRANKENIDEENRKHLESGRSLSEVEKTAAAQERVKSVIENRYLLRTDETKIEESNNEESKLEDSRTEVRRTNQGQTSVSYMTEGSRFNPLCEGNLRENETQSQTQTSRKSFEIKDISKFIQASKIKVSPVEDILDKFTIDQSQLAQFLNQPFSANDSSSGDLGEVTQNLTQRFNQSMSPGLSPSNENERYAQRATRLEEEDTTMELAKCIGSPLQKAEAYSLADLPPASECVEGVHLIEGSRMLDHFQNSLSTIREQNSLLSSLKLTGPYSRPQGVLGGTGGSSLFGNTFEAARLNSARMESSRLDSGRCLQSSVEILSRINPRAGRMMETDTSFDLKSSLKNFSISPILSQEPDSVSK